MSHLDKINQVRARKAANYRPADGCALCHHVRLVKSPMTKYEAHFCHIHGKVEVGWTCNDYERKGQDDG